MAPPKKIGILISIICALQGVLGASATLNLGGSSFDFSTATTSTSGVVSETSSASAATSNGGDPGAITTAPPDDLSTVSITGSDGYEVAEGCVRECLMQEAFGGQPDGLILAAALGCTSPYYNGCYCTAAVASEATSLISRCVIQVCTGTAEIPDAFSIYDTYCTSAGYPRSVLATTTTVNAGNPSTAVVSGAVVYTVTNVGSTFQITETGVQTIITTQTSTPSSGGGGGQKVNVAGIVGGVLGALILIAVLLGVFLVWLPRRQKKKGLLVQQQVSTQPQAPGEPGSTFVPGAAAVGVRKAGGRAELSEKGSAGVVGEKEVIEDVKKEGKVWADLTVDRGVEIDGTGTQGRYGLRAEELDSEGRYVGELHGDGRQFGGGVELPGSEVR